MTSVPILKTAIAATVAAATLAGATLASATPAEASYRGYRHAYHGGGYGYRPYRRNPGAALAAVRGLALPFLAGTRLEDAANALANR